VLSDTFASASPKPERFATSNSRLAVGFVQRSGDGLLELQRLASLERRCPLRLTQGCTRCRYVSFGVSPLRRRLWSSNRSSLGKQGFAWQGDPR